MLFVVVDAMVFKLIVVICKVYGVGYYVMGGRVYELDLFVAWFIVEISVMGFEGMVSIAMGKALEAAPDLIVMRKQLADQIRPFIDVYKVVGHAYVDEVIDFCETRKVFLYALELTVNKMVERLFRKKGIVFV